MADQKLIPFKIHAYEVVPQRLENDAEDPRGGAFTADAAFKLELEKYLKNSKLPSRPEISFRFEDMTETGIRSHTVRQSIMDYCFGASATSKKASLKLARLLSKSMDNRSPYTLLMLVAYKGQTDESFRRLVMWAFPKDEPFQFTARNGTAKIKIPKDIFSRSSSFKKGSLYEGFQNDSAFLQGYVIDRQAENSWGTAADYWVSQFLDSQFSLTGTAGTRLLARTLKLTHENLIESTDRNQITDSIRAAFTSTKQRLSMHIYANEYLTGNAKSTFLSYSPPETLKTKFDFDKAEFEEKVQLRVFRLDNDVVVSAPFSTINHSVKLTGKDSKKIRVTGTIVEETVKQGRKKKKKAAKKTVKRKERA
ncbi:MAG: hypothetical protein CME32_27205 [Gimesia sp.]|nr:hypothetical protein [Gimesia sp.]